ncbi:MAG: hypothetical protein WCT19_01715 [Candidatus Paceibacterota bacterium]
MKKLNVLVFDDSKKHRDAAIAQLGKKCNLTVVDTYDKAQELLATTYDYKLAHKLSKEKYGSDDPAVWKVSPDERVRRREELSRLATSNPAEKFDAVLTDLMVPASQQKLRQSCNLAGQEMPLGAIIALLAIHNGVKKVAVVTDSNHHDNPASAALDCFQTSMCEGIELFCTNHCVVESCGEYVKDWATVLGVLCREIK